jgi:deferrochelatase/peroxidase EfeB
VTGDDIPNAFDFSADVDGAVCPLAAHIRKVNPRAQAAVDVPPRFRRLMRRGIPYGDPPIDRHADDGDDRGLLFVSYQTSIINQFEGVVEDWMNDPDRPAVTGAGHDILVGQVEGSRRMRMSHDDSAVVLDTDARWIVPSGGVYAFVPSILALEHLSQTH